MANAPATIYCTTAADGTVWEASGDRASAPAGATPRHYAIALAARTAGRAGTVRVLGARENAELIVWLNDRAFVSEVLAGGGLRLEVGRPAAVDWGALAGLGPRASLLQMRMSAGGAASLGGWHPLSLAEGVTYALIAAERLPVTTAADLVKILGVHPAYPALSFLLGRDDLAIARLIALVVDPRGFVDPEHPDRMARLRAYLGLGGGRPSAERYERSLLVRRCWDDGRMTASIAAPGYFLRRHQIAAGVAAASRRFVAFLAWNWLDALARPRVRPGASPHPQGLFIPRHYFDDAIDARAFEAHLETSRRGLSNAELSPPGTPRPSD